MLNTARSFLCVHGQGLAHWACGGCTDKGRCVVHRTRVVSTGRLWGETTPKSQTACIFGCPGVPESAVHVCPRLEDKGGAMVCRGVGIFASMAEAQLRVPGSFLAHPQGPLVTVGRTSEFSFPHHVNISIPSMTAAVLLRLSYTAPGRPKIVQHALVLPGCAHAVPLFPQQQPSYGSAEPRVVTRAVATVSSSASYGKLHGWSVHQLLAVQRSACASARWADITGSVRTCTVLPPEAVRCGVKLLAGVPPVQAAYLRDGQGVRCAHCGTFHQSMARFVAVCAPEYPELAA